MTQSGKSLFYFGIYTAIAGILFLLVPETLINMFQLPALPNGWARFIGLLVLVIGLYDLLCGRYDIKIYIKASVYLRFGFFVGCLLLISTGQMPLNLLMLGIVDALGATWTAFALKAESYP
ncbi:MAG: DUF2065 family protein [Saprospiraceae bacterium]|nr:DUF2065 family protein [Saprospiraceae bacterium]MBK7736727.1 DUF2065 family protein [Saprospiraceae bacterium]MBK7911910.1 DUF2065 family protein [Saprospiraceae bacterium]